AEMTPRASFSPRARHDLLEQFVYLDEQGDEETARRYFDAVRITATTLVKHPFSGAFFKASAPRPKKTCATFLLSGRSTST
ncbi:MAG: type II toxin-antitoxin system RelE/ParE family toxin, partial [Candidatus Acidiferrum sp.]